MALKKTNVYKLKTQSVYKKLTNRTASAYKPRIYELYVRDTELKGFYLRLQPTGYCSYGIVSKIGSSRKNKQMSIGSIDLYNQAQARAIAVEWLKLLKQGIDPSQAIKKQTDESLNNPSLEYVHQLYLDSRTLRVKTTKDYANVWKQPFVAKLGRKPIKDITVQEIVTWYNTNKEKKPRQTQKAYTMFSSAYSYAVGLDILEVNILEAKVKALIEQVKYKPKNTYLGLDKELPAFLKAISDLSSGDEYFNTTARDWILFCLMHGFRTSECSKLEWSMIDMDKKSFTLPASITKQAQDLELPLTNLSTVMLTSRTNSKKKHKKYIFPNIDNSGFIIDARGTIDKIKEHVSHALKDDDFHTSFHDFRSTFENILISMKVPIDERQRLMNHSRTKTSQAVYARDVTAVQRDILNEYNNELQKGMNHRGELFGLYAWDEGVQTDFIIEKFTGITDPTFDLPLKSQGKKREEPLEVMLKRGLDR